MFSLREYGKDTKGNMALIAAFGLSVITIAAAAAIEVGNMAKIKNSLQSQVDIATLAVAKSLVENETSENDYVTAAFDVMVENGYDDTNKQPTVLMSGTHLDVSASVDYQSIFPALIPSSGRAISVTSQASIPSAGEVEMVLVLDNTQSMSIGGKMGALKIGAGNLVHAVESSGSDSKIGIVPFARYVNIGELSGSWLDTPNEYDTDRTWQQATHSGGDCQMEELTETRDGLEYTYDAEVCVDQITTYEEQSTVIESRFEGCVGTPEEPDHLAPISNTNRVPGLLNSVPKEVTGLDFDRNAHCPQPIFELSNDYDDAVAHINSLYGVDVTNIPSGLLWGDRLLAGSVALDNSPEEDADTRQIMVLMTDGKNTAEIRTTNQHEYYLSAPPYLYYDKDGELSVPKADADTITLCDRIKARNVELYTIIFQIEDTDTNTLLQDCASSPQHAFRAEDNEALIDVFENIGKNLSANVRLTQ